MSVAGLAVAVAVVAVAVGRSNEDFFVDVDEWENSLNVENRMELVDDEYLFHRSVELVLFQHYFQHMLNLQIHNADASLALTTFNDAVTYYFRNVVVGRASFSALDERRERKREKREKDVGVPLAATIVAVAMADVRSIGWTSLFFSFLFSLVSRARPKETRAEKRIMKYL